MLYFDLDPETATIHDLWGCLTFPDDPVSAQKYAIREQIIWHGMIVADVARNENIARALKEIKRWTPFVGQVGGENKVELASHF